MVQNILKTLEYDKVKQQISEYLNTVTGKQLLDKLKPSSDVAEVQQWIDETKDGADILRLKGGIPVAQLADIQMQLKRLAIGAELNGLELAQIGRVLRTVSEVVKFFNNLNDDEVALRRLYQLSDELVELPVLSRKLRVALADDGSVNDEASDKLKALRHGLQSIEAQIRNKMNDYIHGGMSKYLSNPIITIRDDRYVIPVKAEYRGNFGGVIHDQSASGQTLFIEPQAVVELNNRLRQQQLEEKNEIARILSELTAEVAPSQTDIALDMDLLGKFDFINAKARYAHDLHATEPHINTNNYIDLQQTWHPLIPLDKVVKNDIHIGKDFQAIIITGPNTGGKTITLKTLGLVEVMAQSGLFIPAREDSQVAVFDHIFADIGDEQSIEQNLSTFSAHMENITAILKHIDKNSLVLFDELGAGTDPQEGAALAIAILNAVGAIGAYAVATTHYPELKAYAYNTPQTINASVEFDSMTLQPTYRLLIGVPGRSNAFDISKRLGLDHNIIEQAKQLMNNESQDLNNMISDLDKKRKIAENEYQQAQQQLTEAQSLHDQLQQAYDYFNNERNDQLNRAKQKANSIVDKAQRKAEAIIADLHKLQQQQNTQIKEDQLIKAKTALNNLHYEDNNLQNNRVLRKAKQQHALHVGDEVRLLQYGNTGTLLKQIDAHHWQVQAGIMRINVSDDEIEKIAAAKQEAETVRHITTIHQQSTVSTKLDLRGQRYDEAMANLDRYIDAALLAGYHSVTIVHGMGTGTIRQGVQNYLKRNSQVKSYHYATANAGGTGATIVEFK